METLLTLSCAFLLAGFVLDVVALATNEWVTGDNGSISGLWSRCGETGACQAVGREERVDAVRAMMVLSVILSGVALFVSFLDLAAIWIRDRNIPWVLRFVTVLTLLSAIMCLIGVLVSEKIPWNIADHDYGYSFWLAVAAIIVFFVAGLFFVVTMVQYHRLQKQKNEQGKDKVFQKKYPFTIPYYDYAIAQQNAQERQAKKSEQVEVESRKSSVYPNDYRYVATSSLPYGVFTRSNSGIENIGFSERSRISTASVTTQYMTPTQEIMGLTTNRGTHGSMVSNDIIRSNLTHGSMVPNEIIRSNRTHGSMVPNEIIRSNPTQLMIGSTPTQRTIQASTTKEIIASTPTHSFTGTRNGPAENLRSSMYARNRLSATTNSRPNSVAPSTSQSGTNVTPSRISRVSRVSRDAYGFPLNYDRDF